MYYKKLTDQDLQNGFKLYAIYKELYKETSKFENYEKSKTRRYYVNLFNFWNSLKCTIDVKEYIKYLDANKIKCTQWCLNSTFNKFLSIYLFNERKDEAIARSEITKLRIKSKLLTENNIEYQDISKDFEAAAKENNNLYIYEYNNLVTEFLSGNISPYILSEALMGEMKKELDFPEDLKKILNYNVWKLKNETN